MHDEVRERFPAYIREHEGVIDFMYTDNRGFVTVGIGMKVDKPEELRGFCSPNLWQPKPGLTLPIDVTTIAKLLQDDHDAVKELGQQGLRQELGDNLESTYKKACAAATKLRLTSDGLTQVFNGKLNQRDNQIRASIYFREWDAYPADAQMVLLDLAWWLPGALTTGGKYKTVDFGPLCEACKRSDFSTAAKEVVRWHARQTRKQARQMMFQNAAVVTQLKWPVSHVYYPNDLDWLLKSRMIGT